MKGKKIIIVGGGIGGLATAALLGKDGNKVTLLEKNESVGGRASVWKKDGFSFDMGPSWYLMPDVFETFFAHFGKKPEEYFTLTRLDPQYRVYFGPKDYIDISKDMKKNNKLFEKLEKGSGTRIASYLGKAKHDYQLAMKYILYKEFRGWRDFFSKDIMREGRQLNVFTTLSNYVSTFVTNKRLQQILMYSIVFLGGSPKNTPAFYSLMSHIDFSMGVYYPDGGIGSVVSALESLAKKNDVMIKTNSPVTKILIENGNATGVQIGKKIIKADVVISNADYPFTEITLLDKQYRSYDENYWKKRTLAPSAFLLYLGINKKLPQLSHHTLSFANNWEEHFSQIFAEKTWPERPSYYICNPSKSDPNVAPKGMENLFILVPVSPFLNDTDEKRQEYADFIIGDLEKMIGEKIKNNIVLQRIFTMRDFKQAYNAYEGTALGLTHTLKQTAFFRPSMKSKKVSNLYFVGQYTQPGIGMPMCLISAELVKKRIYEEQ